MHSVQNKQYQVTSKKNIWEIHESCQFVIEWSKIVEKKTEQTHIVSDNQYNRDSHFERMME